MKLSELLGPKRIAIGQPVTSKKRALEEISRLLVVDAPTLVMTDVMASLSNREKLGSTGLGHGVAIPHGRIPGITTTQGAFLRLKHAIDYESHDGRAVDLIFGLLVPQQATGEHLKHLAAIAEKFSDDGFCEAVRRAEDERAVMTLLSS